MAGLKIYTDKKVERNIRNLCASSYPVERPFYLLGTIDGDTIKITSIYNPEDWWKVSSPDMIKWKHEQWGEEAEKLASKEGVSVVGTLHSHPYSEELIYWKPCATAPSDTDWKNFSHMPCIGICTVYKLNSGKMKTFYRVYGSIKTEMI